LKKPADEMLYPWASSIRGFLIENFLAIAQQKLEKILRFKFPTIF